ncbi:MAG: CDP-diacylglycerol--glycerol-3-phosphate 3-phosphatidyltransferase [Candidatus Zixiibacteriota bacterium]
MPNKLTLARIILSPIFMSFFLVDNAYSRIFGFLLYIFAALTDLFDGHYARKYGIVTGFGKFMDPLADKILVSSAFIGLVAMGYARAWMIVLIIARDFYVTGLRSLAAYRGTVIPASSMAKLKTVMQMTVISFIMLIITMDSLFQIYPSPLSSLLQFDRQLVYDIIMGIVTILTVYTGFDYTFKYYSMIKNVLK